MKIFAFTVLCLSCLLFSSCRKENRVDSKSPYYFYSEDSAKILFDTNQGISSIVGKSDYRDVTTDVQNFLVISTEYAKDSKFLYYQYIALKNGDINSFYWDKENKLPKDKKHVYHPVPESEKLKVVKYADPETYEIVKPELVCQGWYRDKNFYFYNHEKTGADRATLSFESPYLPFDKQYVFSVDKGKVNKRAYQGDIKILTPHLLRDNHAYYFKAGCDSMSYNINYIDDEAFEYYDTYDHVFRIDHRIYFMGILINSGNVDAESFEFLESKYSKDKDRVYYRNELIEGADPATIEVLGEGYAKDKNKVYDDGSALENYEPSTFEKDSWGRFPTDSNYGKAPEARRRSRDDD